MSVLMQIENKGNLNQTEKVQPLCPIFGECGGCQYQDIPYHEELRVKENVLKNLFKTASIVNDQLFDPICASPKPYHYRNRLDLQFFKNKSNDIQIGFSPTGRFRVLPIQACPIAMEGISDFLPQLSHKHRLEAKRKLYELETIINTFESL